MGVLMRLPFITVGLIFAGLIGGGGAAYAAGPLPSGTANVVLVDQNSSSTVYVGTGGGLFRSLNGGATWSNAGVPWPSYDIRAIASDPTNSSKLYVGGSNGVFVTTNGGQSWAATGTGCAQAVAVDPTNPLTVFADSCGWGIYRSTDGVKTWAEISSSFPQASVTAFAINPTN